MIATQTFDCTGEIVFGDLSPETVRRLAGMGGDWLEFDPSGGRVVVRHVQPEGAPAISAVPAELIAMLAALAPEERERVRGGELVVRDRPGVALRLVVEAGEIRVQWPREDWSHAIEVPLDEAFAAVVPASARVSGTLGFTAPPGARAELVDFVERFEGLYPEGDLRLDREGAEVRVELRGLNVGPAELYEKLRALAKPLTSLAGALDVSSFVPNALERDFRLTIIAGEARAEWPALWRQG